MCCSPYIATVVAGVLGIVESLRGLGWNFEIALMITNRETNYSYIPPIISARPLVHENFALYSVAITCIFLHFLWFIFSCVMLKGNESMKKGMIWPWLIHTQIMLVISVSVGTWFLMRYADQRGKGLEARMMRSTYLKMAAGYSGWFFLMPATNAVLTILVARRMGEISKLQLREAARLGLQNLLSRQQSDPPPYRVVVGEERDVSQLFNVTANREPLRRNPPQRPPPPDMSAVSGWSHETLLRNDVLETANQEPTETSDTGASCKTES